MFGKKKSSFAATEEKYADPALYKAAMRCSICTGEQVAGFRNLQTGKFEEVMLIRSDEELQDFLNTYQLTEVERFY